MIEKLIQQNKKAYECDCGGKLYTEEEERGDYHPDTGYIYYIKIIACTKCDYQKDYYT